MDLVGRRLGSGFGGSLGLGFGSGGNLGFDCVLDFVGSDMNMDASGVGTGMTSGSGMSNCKTSSTSVGRGMTSGGGVHMGVTSGSGVVASLLSTGGGSVLPTCEFLDCRLHLPRELWSAGGLLSLPGMFLMDGFVDPHAWHQSPWGLSYKGV